MKKRSKKLLSVDDPLVAASVVWRPQREDLWPLAVVTLLPLLVALPILAGLLDANPMLYVGDLAQHMIPGPLPGLPYIDPNNGYTTQALGKLGAEMWLHGEVPWWNYYSGVGMPLTAEYQPATFFPLTLLLLLPKGMIWRHLALQILAGWGCYGLVRQLGAGKLAALTGGLLFAQCGTLAWFADAPVGPIPFLPWLMLGVERAAANDRGWRLLGFAWGLMLLSGFPETTYICGLLVGAFAIWRGAQSPAAARWGMIRRLLVGGLVGFALAAPQLLPFLKFLPRAYVGGHSGALGHVALPAQAIVPGLLAPFAFGPILAYGGEWAPIYQMWRYIGGYVDILLLVAASYGVWCRRDGLGWLLGGWIVLALAKIFGSWPLAEWWNLIPGVGQTEFYRYAAPTVEFAAAVLAAFAVEALAGAAPRQAALWGAGVVLGVGVVFGLCYGFRIWPEIAPHSGLRHWALASAGWAAISGLLALGLLARAPHRWRAQALAALLVVDATAMFAIPGFSSPRGGDIDTRAIGFLQSNLGLQRFFTLGPIQPNYGAYFGIASINHNYIPIPLNWLTWVHGHLDSAAEPNAFNGNNHIDPNQPSAAEELRRNVAGYEEAAGKYVVAPAGANPFVQDLATKTENDGNQPLALAPGQSAHGMVPASVLALSAGVGAVGVMLGNYDGTADGTLVVELCVSAGKCVSGAADLTGSRDNAVFWVPLSHALTLPAGKPVSYSINHQGGTRAAALWAYPAEVSQALTGPGGPLPGFGLQLHLRQAQSGALPPLVYADGLMNIYQLPSPRPYFEILAGSCALQPQSRTSVLAYCGTTSKLVRRELFFPGWRARIGRQPVPIEEQGGLFQSVDLPAGRNMIDFSYAPPHILWAWLMMGLALAALALSGTRAVKN